MNKRDRARRKTILLLVSNLRTEDLPVVYWQKSAKMKGCHWLFPETRDMEASGHKPGLGIRLLNTYSLDQRRTMQPHNSVSDSTDHILPSLGHQQLENALL